MNYKDILQNVLVYIDEHIQDELSAEILSAVAGFSPFHFCRVFQWGVGYSVMEYVRSRRLAFAASELSSGRKIIDIAMDYGFDTHSGFGKAFKRRFHCSPDVYRRHAVYRVPPLPSIDIMDKYAIGGIVMEPRIIEKPTTRIVGYALKTCSADGENTRAIPAFWSEYLADGRAKKLHDSDFVLSHDELGACFPVNPETGEFEYMIGVALKEGAAVPGEFVVRDIPAATYAVFSTPPVDASIFSPTIQGVWGYIYAEWFPGSGYEFAPGGVDYEFYDYSIMGETDNVCDIYIPVVKTE